jgi:hypothetical protein
MSGLSQFKSFILSEELKQMDKEAFQSALLDFINETQNKEEQKAKDETNDKTKCETNKYNSNGTFNPRKFLSSNPSLKDFQALDQLQLSQCVDFDKKQPCRLTNVIYNIEKTKENTPLIIFLLENGFVPDCHTDKILENNNLPLLRYYYENNLCKEVFHILYVIKNNNMEILEYILETNLIKINLYKLRDAFKNCVKFNRIDMLDLLCFRYESLFKQVLSESLLEIKVTMLKESYPESMNISQELFTWLLEQKEYLGLLKNETN